jgi:hypothetical protein
MCNGAVFVDLRLALESGIAGNYDLALGDSAEAVFSASKCAQAEKQNSADLTPTGGQRRSACRGCRLAFFRP